MREQLKEETQSQWQAAFAGLRCNLLPPAKGMVLHWTEGQSPCELSVVSHHACLSRLREACWRMIHCSDQLFAQGVVQWSEMTAAEPAVVAHAYPELAALSALALWLTESAESAVPAVIDPEPAELVALVSSALSNVHPAELAEPAGRSVWPSASASCPFWPCPASQTQHVLPEHPVSGNAQVSTSAYMLTLHRQNQSTEPLLSTLG